MLRCLVALSLVSAVVAQVSTANVEVNHPDCTPGSCGHCRELVTIDNCIRVAFTYQHEDTSAGLEMLEGYKFWAQRVNGQGGVVDASGKTWFIELTSYDDQGSGSVSGEVYQHLAQSTDVEHDYDIFFGPYGSSVNLAALHALDSVDYDQQRPMILSNGPAGTTLVAPRGYVVGVMTTGYDFVRPALEQLHYQGARRVALLVNPANAMSESIFQGALQQMAELGMDVAGVQLFGTGMSHDDWVGKLKTIKSEGDFDVLLGCFTRGNPIPVTEAMKDAGIRPKAFVFTYAARLVVLDDLGDLAQHMISTEQWSYKVDHDNWSDNLFGTPQEFHRDFQQTMRPPNTEMTDPHAASAAAAGLVLYKAIQTMHSDDTNGTFDPHEMKEILKNVNLPTSFYGPIAFDEYGHNTLKSMVLTQVMPISGGNRDYDLSVVTSATGLEYPAKLSWGGGMSGFGIFCLVTFCVITALCIAGCVYKHQTKGARGVEMIPGIDTFRECQGKLCGGSSSSSATRFDDEDEDTI